MGHIPLITKISGPEEELGSSTTHTAVPSGEIITDAALRQQDHTTSADGMDYDSETPAEPRRALGYYGSLLGRTEVWVNDMNDPGDSPRTTSSCLLSPKSTVLTPLSKETSISSVPSHRLTAHSSGSTLDSDMISISDSSEEFRPTSPGSTAHNILRVVLSRLLLEFWASKRGNTSPPVQQQPPSASAQGDQPASDRPTKSSHKRANRQEDGDDDISGDKPTPSIGKRLKLDSTRKPSLACPFWKHDRERYSKCGGLVLNRIRDVKQHLNRRHYREFYCPRCFLVFKDEQACSHHTSGVICQPSSGRLDGISHHQRNALTKKSNPKLNEEGQWFAIWEILFPGHKRPDSPYLDPELSTDFFEFQQYSAERGPAILEEVLNDNTIWSMSEGDRRLRLRDILAEGLRAIRGNWIIGRSVSPLRGRSSRTSMSVQASRIVTSDGIFGPVTQNSTTPMDAGSTTSINVGQAHQAEGRAELPVPQLQVAEPGTRSSLTMEETRLRGQRLDDAQRRGFLDGSGAIDDDILGGYHPSNEGFLTIGDSLNASSDFIQGDSVHIDFELFSADELASTFNRWSESNEDLDVN